MILKKKCGYTVTFNPLSILKYFVIDPFAEHMKCKMYKLT